jgi:hypothetical protein
MKISEKYRAKALASEKLGRDARDSTSKRLNGTRLLTALHRMTQTAT